MNDKLQKLYNLYKQQGLITDATSFEKFSNATPEQQTALYNLGVDNGLFLETGEPKFKNLFEESKPKEPGFFDRAMSGISDLFSSDDDVKKKAASTASSSGKSLSALPSKPKDEFQLAAAKMRGEFIPPTGTLEEQAKSVAGQESYMGMTVPKEKTYAGKQEKERQVQNKLSALASQEDYKESVGQINQDLISNDEQNVVPRLNYLFKDYGFSFDEAGAGYDAITVTAPNGNTLDLSIDRFTDKGDIESSNELKAFMEANKPKIENAKTPYDQYYKRYKTQKEVDSSLKSIGDETNRLLNEENYLAFQYGKLSDEKDLIDKMPDGPERQQKVSELMAKENELESRQKLFQENKKRNINNKTKLDEAVGQYTRARAEEGGIVKASWNTMVSGVGKIAYGVSDMLAWVGNHMQEGMTYEEATQAYEDVKKERISKIPEALQESVGFTSVSKEYEEAAQKDFLKRNVLGVAGFLPMLGAMTVAPEVAVPMFFASGYGGAMEEMDKSEAFKDVSSGEKVAVASVLGTIEAVLMTNGVTNRVLNTAYGKQLIESTIKRMGSETSAKTIQEFVENEVKSGLARGLITTSSAAAHGAALGVELKVGEDAAKYTYNKLKEEDKFQMPETFGGWLKEVGESGLDMAVGGAMMSSIKSIRTGYSKNNFDGVTDATIDNYKFLEAPEVLRAYEESLNIKVANGEMTRSEKNAEMNDVNMSLSVLNKMPEDFNPAQKRKAFSLMRERDILEQRIDGKDKSLVKGETERITEINKELEDVSKISRAEAPAAPETPVTPEAQPAKPKTLDEIQDEDVKSSLNLYKENLENFLKEDEEDYNKAKESFDKKNPIVRFFGKKPNYEEYTQYTKNKLELLNNNPEQYLSDVVKEYEESKKEYEKDGEEFPQRAQETLDYIKNQLSKIQEENAIQKPTTEESVLRTEQPEVELPTMGEGNAQETTTQEGVAPAKSEEVKPTEEKPHEQQLAELEQMFPEEKTGENKGVAASDNKAMDEMLSRTKDERVQKVIKTAQRLTKTLRSLFPTADIHIHENEESYNGAMEETNGEKGSNGNFNFGVDADGKPFVRIDINASKASSKDVAHEVGHAILQKAFGDNQKLFQSFQERIAKVLSNEKNKALLDFINNPKYKEKGVTYEEYMAELKAVLSEQGEKIELSTAKKIAAVINEFVSKITNGKFKPFQEVTDVKQVVDFVNKVTEAMAKGEAIDVEAAEKMGEGSRSSIRVFHGTPHKFDKFTTEKMGTGEGAQAFGWGLYFTDLKDIAKTYAKQLGSLHSKVYANGKEVNYGHPLYNYENFIIDAKGDVAAVLKELKEIQQEEDALNIKENTRSKAEKKAIAFLEKNPEIKYDIPSNIYDVTLHEGKTPDQYTYLEWDKPLSDANRKKILSQFEKENIEPHSFFKDDAPQMASGRQAYELLESKLKSPKEASLFLLRAGVDGIKFPAESISRGATSENARAFNYVVFDENTTTINSVSRSSLRTAEQVDKMVKDARASGYSERAIEEFLQKRGVDQSIIDKSLGKKEAGKKIITNEEMMPGYDKMMDDVNSEILRGLDRKTSETTIKKNVMKIVEGSEAYKNATDQQREQMIRDVKEAFGEKMKEAPSAEKITGKEDKTATENANKLKDQIKLEAKAAKEGASSVKTAIKKIRDFVVNNKETANLTRKDLLKVIDIMKSVNDEKSLEKATTKVLDIIDKANKDIIEVSKTKMDAAKMKAELKAAKDSAKGVVNKIKAVKAYFDSVQEYGNLTRKDLRRIMKEIASVKDEASLDKAVNNINDIIDKATSDKIEISEKKMIANTIKEVKLAKGNIKEKRKMIADVIDEIKKSGKLSASQVNALLKRANRLNVESFEHLNKFIEYTEKLFADAEYDNKLSKANAERASIRKSSKNKGNKYDANLVRLAERFLTIDPSLVENIDEYNKMASDIAQAIKGSSAKAFKPTVEIKAADAYIEEAMKAQKEKLTEMMREQVEELLGVDGSTLTYDEMIKMMESEKKDMSEQKEKIIRSAAIKLFESLSSNIEYILEKGKDPFTGEDVDIKQSKKDVVKRFMEMDLTKMDIKDAIAAVDALNNFIVNQSTAKMDDVVSKYEGRQNNAELNSKGIVSKPLRLYFNKYIGRVMLEQFANLPIVFERLFKSPAMGAYVQKMMGVTELINNKSKAEAIVKSAVNKFTEKFYKDKANGENFNSSFNNLERGVFADLYRTVIGTPEQVKQEFERNKGLLEQTIKKLSRGTESQKKESQILQKVYDKIVKDSDSIEDVKSKMDAKNVEAVEYWVEKWAEHYEDLADVSENVYNRILDKELNYTPKRMSKIKEDNSLDTEESAFHKNNGTLFKKSTGSLMEATKPDELPENRYVDYSFDSKMANSFQDALVDIYTAANVRKVEAFIKDKGFEDIFPNAEDRVLLEKRIKLMVDNFRNKNHYDYNELSKGMKYVNKLGNIGVAAALGGVFQPIKQTVPVAINTLVNAGGINMDRLFSKSYRRVTNEFLDKSGYAIANRGKESTSDIKAIDTMIEDVATNAASKGVEWTTKKLGKIQDFYLKKLLVNPDVGIARISWLTYYEKSLKEQGKDVENIDYSDHELNKEAADYAQKMVDRQQNISDADLKGEFFSNKSAANQFISKIIFPFASFRMNQSARLASDFITLTSKTASEQDRRTAARSLAGASAEIAAFNTIGAGLATLLYSGVKSLMADDDEDEEDKKKREEADQKYIDMIIKGRATSAVQDFLSPLPFADYLVQKGVYNTIDVFNGEEKKGKKDEQFNILKPRAREGLQSLGTLGIFPLRMYDLYSITSMASSGTFEDDYGNTKNIREKDKGVLKNVLIPLAAINSTGALPAESYTVQNMILKDIKKRASTQTEAEIIQEKAKKREKRADNIEKIQVINRAIDVATDQDVVNELMKMKRETRMELFPEKMSDEAKEVLKRKREREKASYKKLLGGYDTKTDLKRYDPDLYEQNFGENSEYGQTHKAEVKADKLFDAMMKKTKDEKYGYTPPPKKKSKKRKKNSDGSYKSSYFRYSSN